jgi:hypothetical protein
LKTLTVDAVVSTEAMVDEFIDTMNADVSLETTFVANFENLATQPQVRETEQPPEGNFIQQRRVRTTSSGPIFVLFGKKTIMV